MRSNVIQFSFDLPLSSCFVYRHEDPFAFAEFPPLRFFGDSIPYLGRRMWRAGARIPHGRRSLAQTALVGGSEIPRQKVERFAISIGRYSLR